VKGAIVAVIVAVALVGGCSDDGTSATSTSAPTTTPAPVATLDTASAAQLGWQVAAAPDCDPLDSTSCLLPFPSDHFTVSDRSTATRRRVSFPNGLLPSVGGTTLDPTEWNRNDGFSPGTPILVKASGVDLAASKLPTLSDIGASLRTSSGSVLVDMNTGKRLAHWAELDAGAKSEDQRLLILHPAAALPEGHRIAVGFVGLRRADGTPLEASLAFRTYRDRLGTSIDPIESRRPAMEQVLTSLGGAGVSRSRLWLAWDFTVASERNLTERLVAMRDDAFRRVGVEGPAFTVDQVVTDPAQLHPGIARLVRGTYAIPSYLTGNGEPGSSLHYGNDHKLPTYAGYDYHAPFSCQVPQSALAGGAGNARAVVYGHGLLGSHDEGESSHVAKVASTDDMVYCATDWLGLSKNDLGNAAKSLMDISNFPTVADRSQQGILDTAMLARLMIGTTGLGTNAAFQDQQGRSVIATGEAYFDGNSMGAIMGGAATAIAPDWTKAVLGVASMDYALLLDRSTDFAQYLPVLTGAYPDRVDQQIIYGVIQMLWDRGETDGYAEQLGTSPLPGSKRKQVLLHAALGDHQVSNAASEYEARTIGARLRQPALAAGRNPEASPYGLPAIPAFPWRGNAVVYFDSGTLPPPLTNMAPPSGPTWIAACGSLDKVTAAADPRCRDPHEDPRRAPESIAMKDAFFRPGSKGAVVDTCKGKPCVAIPSNQLDY
jgi:hypothetical protein